jgi:DNA-binding MarR family transcriptional regulator
MTCILDYTQAEVDHLNRMGAASIAEHEEEEKQLAHLYTNTSMSVVEIAEFLRMTPTKANRMVKRLAFHGLIERRGRNYDQKNRQRVERRAAITSAIAAMPATFSLTDICAKAPDIPRRSVSIFMLHVSTVEMYQVQKRECQCPERFYRKVVA